MTDLGTTIAPKSDQLNADDLLVDPLTVRITKVSANPGSAEQPISIYFENDNGKPYKPCKSMRRVLIQVWGRDGAAYVGRRMTLFRDPSVMFGGVAVGGIRISHMSEIDAPVSMALTANRASRKQYTVQPLGDESKPTKQREAKTLDERTDLLIEAFGKATTVDALNRLKEKGGNLIAELETAGRGILIDKIENAYQEKLRALKEQA